MKISKVEVIAFSIPYRVPVTIATGTLKTQDSVLVRVTAENGIVGLGETQPIPFFQGCAETQDSILALIRHAYAPLLTGQRALDVEKINQSLEHAVRGGEYARAAVGDALYDLAAKLLGVPLYDLLGGLYHDKIPGVWSVGMKSTEAMAEEAHFHHDRGYFLLKCKIGSFDGDADVRNVAAIRKALGPHVRFRVDGNAGMRYAEALPRLKRMVDESGIEFVEQPVPIWDLPGMAQLGNVLGVPIMADESVSSPPTAMALAHTRAASIFDIKLAKMGGIYSARKIAAIADAAGIPLYAGGQVATSIGAATAAHFFAATWNTVGGDFQLGPDGWLGADIAKNPLKVKDGYAYVPVDGPGIGIELDESKLERWALKK